MQEKERVFFSVCSAILKMEVEKGHLGWTLSDISRESNITRSLIYYYFGKEKDQILHEAYKFIIATFFEHDPQGSVPKRMKVILQQVKLMPYLFVLFYLQRDLDTEVGQMIRTAEALSLKNLQSSYPHLNEQQVKALYMKELGAIAFHLPPEEVDDYFAEYKK
ncbi:hypothetical protein D3C87_257210 [compost metagenome]